MEQAQRGELLATRLRGDITVLGTAYRDWLGEGMARDPEQPVPPLYTRPAPYAPGSLRGKYSQIIVEVTGVHLTPDAPHRAEEPWHVEGTGSERVVATGKYFFHSENVTTPGIHFREAVSDLEYGPDDAECVRAVYGLVAGDPSAQRLGAVDAREGRCLVYPNVYQTRTGACELVDKTRPGCRRVLTFHLLDPARSVASTARIPPQDPVWRACALRRGPRSAFSGLPAGVVLRIVYLLDGLYSAKQHGRGAEQHGRDFRRIFAEHAEAAAQAIEEKFERPFSLNGY